MWSFDWILYNRNVCLLTDRKYPFFPGPGRLEGRWIALRLNGLRYSLAAGMKHTRQYSRKMVSKQVLHYSLEFVFMSKRGWQPSYLIIFFLLTLPCSPRLFPTFPPTKRTTLGLVGNVQLFFSMLYALRQIPSCKMRDIKTTHMTSMAPGKMTASVNSFSSVFNNWEACWT